MNLSLNSHATYWHTGSMSSLNAQDLYDGTPIEQWKTLLAPCNWHYHFGLPGPDNLFDNSVSEILPLLSGHILDLGCGFGGPAGLISKAGHRVTCVTHSEAQKRFIRAHQPEREVVVQDVNQPDLPTANTALMMESLSHIDQASALLKHLHPRVDQIVAVCHYSRSDSFIHPLWQMNFRSEQDLRALFRDAGWHIQTFTNRMPDKALPTAQAWLDALNQIPRNQWTPHLVYLYELAEQIQTQTQGFIAEFGLATLKATKHEECT